ncbi:MAG: LysM domain-containing protein [Candidatus Gracilibacteria bacterium]|nr:LysM domain-containing protein [Candidatus Gracilibacteria bacterium]
MADLDQIKPLEELKAGNIEENPELTRIRNIIVSNTVKYEIKDGDTISSIAKNGGFSESDLIDLNMLLGKNLKTKGKNQSIIVIKPGEKIFIPRDIQEFNRNLEKIKEISKILNLNRKITNRDSKIIKKELDGSLFSKRVQSIGLPNILDGFMNAQKSQMDPRLPRIVDSSREVNVTCANLIRTLMSQSVNVGDIRPEEKRFLQKQNIDAWMLPAELKSIGFSQPINLMEHFDGKKIGEINPLKETDRKEYESGILDLGKYLERSGVKGSLVPYYFIYSNYKGKTAEYNKDRKDKHYNTHQSMFAGNISWNFEASQIGNIKDGKVESFADDKKELQKDLKLLEFERGKSDKDLSARKQRLLESMDLNKNESLRKKIYLIDIAIKRLSEGSSDRAEKMKKVIETKNKDNILEGVSAILKYRISEEDAGYLLSLENSRFRALDGLRQLSNDIKSSKELNISDYGKLIETNAMTKTSINQYNISIKKNNGINNLIQEKNQGLGALAKSEVDRIVEGRKADSELRVLDIEFRKERSEIEKSRIILINALNNEQNQELKAKIERNYTIIFKNINLPNEGAKKGFLNALINNDQSLISNHILDEEDMEYRRNLLFSIRKAENSINQIKGFIGTKDDEISALSIGKILSDNRIISEALKNYNSNAEKMISLKSRISENKDKLKMEKSITVIDFIANFIQTRADIGSAYSQELRKRIYDGLEKYPDLVNIKVDGIKVDLVSEMKRFRNGKTGSMQIRPTSKIELSGPIMIDGEHQITSLDEDRRKKMNARTRMFFEFVVPGLYLPTEILEPGKNSSFRKDKFQKNQDNLKIKGTYDVRRGETVEKVLREQIKIYEQLDPQDPKFVQKINRYYDLQIKGLKLGGFLQDENVLNPGAFNINRALPYYETAGISGNFKEFINQKKTNFKLSNENMSELKEFIDIKTFPGDTSVHIFNRIRDYVVHYSSKFDKFDNLRLISELNEFQQRMFLVKFLDRSIKKDIKFNSKSFLKNIKPGKTFIMPFSDMNDILGEINSIYYTSDIPQNKYDDKLIDIAVGTNQNRNLIKTIEYMEVYDRGKSNGMISRKQVKRSLENLNRTFGIDLIKSMGDFQIRVDTIDKGWNEWITKENLLNFFSKTEGQEFKDYLNSLTAKQKSAAKGDIDTAEKLKSIINKDNLDKDDFKDIKKYLKELIRIDSGDGSNFIGKMLGASLLSDKINVHFQKFNGILYNAGENIDDIYSDKDKMRDYESSILLINHLGENSALYAFAENCILRIFDGAMGLNVESESVYDDSFKGKALGRIKYGRNTFLKHLKKYCRDYEKQVKTPEDKKIFEKIKKLSIDLTSSKNFNSTLFDFIRDPELKFYLKAKNVNPSLIPEKEELSEGRFQNSIFNYLNKNNTNQNHQESKL